MLINVGKCWYVLIGKDVLPENNLLEQATTLKRFEYFSLRQELKAHCKETGSTTKRY